MYFEHYILRFSWKMPYLLSACKAVYNNYALYCSFLYNYIYGGLIEDLFMEGNNRSCEPLKFRPGEVASGDPEGLLLRCCMLKFDNICTYFLCVLPLVWLLIYCVMEPYAYSYN